MSGPTTATGARSDSVRFASAGLIFAGRVFLFLSFLYLAIWQWRGLPLTTTPWRVTFFGLLGLLLGLLGYRLGSARWTDAWQLPLQAAALAGVLFLILVVSKGLARRSAPLPPAWLMGLAVAMPLIWRWLAPSRRRHTD